MTKLELTNELVRVDECNALVDNEDQMRTKLKSHQRKRFLQFWADGSSIDNNGHMLIMVNVLYDKSIYLTNEEYYSRYRKCVDVQAEVEMPELYIIARCPSNDQQLLYIDTRNVGIKDLRHPTMVSGVDLYDIIRCFHGDGPACQLEAGQQKGGDFPCWICSVNINNCTDIPYVYYQPIMGLTERINKVLNSNTSRRKAKLNNLHMFTKLKKHEIELELSQRNIPYSTEDKIEVIKTKLKKHMHGMQRLPALFFNEWQNRDMLNSYEILPCEPLHDIKGHITNIYEEIVYHATNEKERSLLKSTIQQSL